jgi:hypothetical protein
MYCNTRLLSTYNVVEQVSASLAVACSESDTCIRNFYSKAKEYLEKRSAVTLDGIEPPQLDVRGFLVEAPIEKMGKVIVDDVPRIRVDALERFLALTQPVIEVDWLNGVTVSSGTMKLLQELATQSQSMIAFIDVHRSRFFELNTGWWVDVLSCELGSAVASRVIAHAALQWDADLEMISFSVSAVAPSRAFVANPKLLVSDAMQKVLFQSPKMAELSAAVCAVRDALALTIGLMKAGLLLSETAAAKARAEKKHGKIGIGLEWALRKLFKEAPTEAKDLADHVKMIKEKIKTKGSVLQPYLVAAMDTMSLAPSLRVDAAISLACRV